MSIPYVSGPAHIYVASGLGMSGGIASSAVATAAQLWYLGSGEQPPNLQFNPQWEPVINDIGGSMLPIDYSYQGEDGLVSVTLNKWNESVYLRLASHSLDQGASVRGRELWDDIGSLSQLEGLNFQLLIAFPYATSKAYGATYNLPVGYRFASCRLANHLIQPGTRQNRRQIVAHCDRSFYAYETSSSSTNKCLLYDHVLTNVPLVPPTGVTGQVSLG